MKIDNTGKGIHPVKDSKLPPVPAPVGNMAGGLGGGLKGAVGHLTSTVKNEAKMHKCMK